MELKLIKHLSRFATHVRFNRTFMELKQSDWTLEAALNDRFNRTFMELKRITAASPFSAALVLIGPSWN